MRIFLDPGHSGPAEPGACAGGASEAAVVLQVAQKLRPLLVSAGYKVLLSREDDIDDDGLLWRVEAAEKFRADLFVSLHCNAAASPAAQGTEVFHYPGSKRGERLARCLQMALVETCQTADRGVKANGEWTVLTATQCPAVLVELAFLSNKADRELLTDKFNQRLFASGLLQGIDAYAGKAEGVAKTATTASTVKS